MFLFVRRLITTAKLEKGGATFQGIKMLLCENPFPPLDEAIAAAQAELRYSNYYTEPYSKTLRRFLADQIGAGATRPH